MVQILKGTKLLQEKVKVQFIFKFSNHLEDLGQHLWQQKQHLKRHLVTKINMKVHWEKIYFSLCLTYDVYNNIK